MKLAFNGTTTKRLVWFLVLNGVAWVWCSYALAYLGREQIAEELSKIALVDIVAVLFTYACKSLFEKRPDFGAIGKEKSHENSI